MLYIKIIYIVDGNFILFIVKCLCQWNYKSLFMMLDFSDFTVSPHSPGYRFSPQHNNTWEEKKPNPSVVHVLVCCWHWGRINFLPLWIMPKEGWSGSGWPGVWFTWRRWNTSAMRFTDDRTTDRSSFNWDAFKYPSQPLMSTDAVFSICFWKIYNNIYKETRGSLSRIPD